MRTNRPARSGRTRRAQPAASSRRSEYPALGRAHLFSVDVDRQKPIDHYIDYFGSGGPPRAGAPLDPRGVSLPGSRHGAP